MKLFELVIGNTRRLVAAEDAEQARRIGQDPTKHPDIHFMPFEVREFVLPGYVINVVPASGAEPPPRIETVDDEQSDEPDEREALKAALKARGVEFNPRWSTDRLRALAEGLED